MKKNLFGSDNDQVSFLVCEKEYDSPELKELLEWLKDKGYSSKDESFSLVGSQEISTYDISKGSVTAQLVFETYEGVTLFTLPENENLFSAIKVNT